MNHKFMDLNEVEQFKIKEDVSADELVKSMGKSGVMGSGRISRAADIMTTMFKDKECTVFLGAAGGGRDGGPGSRGPSRTRRCRC